MATRWYDESKGVFIRWSPMGPTFSHKVGHGGPKENDGEVQSSGVDYWANDYFSSAHFGDDYWS